MEIRIVNNTKFTTHSHLSGCVLIIACDSELSEDENPDTPYVSALNLAPKPSGSAFTPHEDVAG